MSIIETNTGHTIETVELPIGPYKFVLGTNNQLQEFARSQLRNRAALYIDSLETLLEEDGALIWLDPYYINIIGSARTVNGDKRSPLLRSFINNPVAWIQFCSDQIIINGSFVDELNVATDEAKRINYESWYPDQPEPEAEAEQEETDRLQQVVNNGLAAKDPESIMVEQPPSDEALEEAVTKLVERADDRSRDTDFLDQPSL